MKKNWMTPEIVSLDVKETAATTDVGWSSDATYVDGSNGDWIEES